MLKLKKKNRKEKKNVSNVEYISDLWMTGRLNTRDPAVCVWLWFSYSSFDQADEPKD